MPTGSCCPAACRRACPTTVYADLVARLKRRGKTVVLDASGAAVGRSDRGSGPTSSSPTSRSFRNWSAARSTARPRVVEAARDAGRSRDRSGRRLHGSARRRLRRWRRRRVLAVPPQHHRQEHGRRGRRHGRRHRHRYPAGPLARPTGRRLATAFSLGALGEIGPRLPPPATSRILYAGSHVCSPLAMHR